MSHRPAIALLLACLSFPLMAKDVRQLGPNSGGGSSEDAAQIEPAAPAARAAAPSHRQAQPAAQTRQTPIRDGGNDIRPPRWHSFLPGMFR